MITSWIPRASVSTVVLCLLTSCLEEPRRPDFSIIDPDETCLLSYVGYPKHIPRRIARDICRRNYEVSVCFMDPNGNCWIGAGCGPITNWEGYDPPTRWCAERAFGELDLPRLPSCKDIGLKLDL